jgi:glycosyltransferase involved in cell wall biosynthesis
MDFFNNKRILIISPEPWGVNFVSKHHYAKALAEKGSIVYFLNPPGRASGGGIKVTEVEEIPNLRIIDYKPFFKGINRLPGVLRNLFFKFELTRVVKAWSDRLDVVWSFDPFRFQKLGQFKAAIKIYHVVDVHNTHLEKIVATSANIVFATSDKILDRLKNVQTPKYKVGHGLAHQFTEIVAPRELLGKARIKVGYVGNLHIQSLAKDILIKIIEQNPAIDFFFIGPYVKSNLSDKSYNDKFIQYLKSSPNVNLLGMVPSSQLPEYMASFDLFLLCYASDRHSAKLANPHKLLEYLSTGKVVVCTYTDEYKDKRDLVEMAEKTKELPQIFSDAIKNLEYLNSHEKMQARKSFANSNTYDVQLKKIENLIAALPCAY